MLAKQIALPETFISQKKVGQQYLFSKERRSHVNFKWGLAKW